MISASIRFSLILSVGTLFCGAAYYTAEQITAVNFPAEGEAPYLFSNQSRDDLTKVYLQSVESAERSILLLIYNLSDASITKALRAKAEAGMEVVVICDGDASAHAKKYLGNKVKVIERRDKGLMHLKILVVDEQLVIIGSANLSRQSLRSYGNLVMAFESRDMAAFIKQRSKEIASGKASLAGRSKQFVVGGQEVELWFLPGGDKGPERILTLIEQAKKSIRVAMYTWTRKDFAEAIVRASLRGVAVKAVIDRSSTKNSSFKIAHYLRREKIPLFVNTTQGLLHHKFLLIDDSIMVNGSANWTKKAFTENNDCFAVIHGLTEQQLERLNAMWDTIEYEAVLFKSR